MRKVTEKKERRIQWEMQQSLEDLDFADDMSFGPESRRHETKVGQT
jgi:hypothetical protein